MAAKLIDLSFTLNGRKVKVQIAPDTMLFALLREQGCASVRCACETTNCGLCTVWLDGDPVLSCSVPAARVEGHAITTLEGLRPSPRHWPVRWLPKVPSSAVFAPPALL